MFRMLERPSLHSHLWLCCTGSVTVDLAAEQGGNVETTVPDQVINHKARLV